MMVQRSSWTLSGSMPCYAQRRWQGRGVCAMLGEGGLWHTLRAFV